MEIKEIVEQWIERSDFEKILKFINKYYQKKIFF